MRVVVRRIARWLRDEEDGTVVNRMQPHVRHDLGLAAYSPTLIRSNAVGRARARRTALAGRPGAARPRSRSGAVVAPSVLTDLLTTALDQTGQLRNDEPCQQDRCDCLDSRGRLQSSS
jgi:hypothetical protein